jgi:hypothetical protein
MRTPTVLDVNLDNEVRILATTGPIFTVAMAPATMTAVAAMPAPSPEDLLQQDDHR